ncbi:MAG: hypothetical protein LH702_02785 [Phormidesmis sp. CAN_BIN44]|nr:hypothetical protein [Phormidesmis sp. CAN_BIN44]
MTQLLDRVFLDTNIYIIGAIDSQSYEAQVLDWLGFGESQPAIVEVIVSEELTDQISRVSKRVKNKDWGGELLARIWQKLNVRYVLLNLQDFSKLEAMGVIPREDIGVYLTAKAGQAQCFVSSNHKLVRALASSTGEFECLTPEEFAKKYILSIDGFRPLK